MASVDSAVSFVSSVNIVDFEFEWECIVTLGGEVYRASRSRENLGGNVEVENNLKCWWA